MRVCAENMKRKLEVGDFIKVRGIKVEIGEILYQYFYKDEYNHTNSTIEGISDRSYIDIEFKDSNGNYRHWKSHLDGGEFEYKGGGTKPPAKDMFIKLFVERGMTLQDTWSLMGSRGYSQTDISVAVLAVIGSCTWVED